MFSNQNRDAIRRSDRTRRPMVESLDGRLLLTVIPGSHPGLATTDAVTGSHGPRYYNLSTTPAPDVLGAPEGSQIGSAIIGRHIGVVSEAFRVGDHIGTSVTAELERKH